MAKKNSKNPADCPYSVEYTERNGEKIVATFRTADHMAMLTERLQRNNVPFTSVSPAE